MILNEVITDIAAGPFGSNLKVECFVPEGFPIIDGANLKDFKVTDNITKFVTEEKARSLHRSIAKRGDVISTISGTLGQIAYIPDDSKYEEYLVSQRQFRITFNTEKVNVPFLVYYFHSRIGQSKILAFANQVGVPALAQPLKNFRNIEVNFPPIDVQNKIASILSSLDDKIAVNKKICENLEAQAQALFKHWFVDFAPFKDGKFVDSELGLIPEGWRVGTFGDVAEINPTRKLSKGQIATYLDMKNMPTSGSFPLNWEEKEFTGGMRFKNGDTLMARITPCLENGKVAYVNFLQDEEIGFGSTEYIVMTAKQSIFPELLYTLCRFPLFVGYATKHMNGSSGRQRVSGDSISNYPMVLAPDAVYNQLRPIFENFMRQIREIGFENLRLATLRDTLLPKLMSGQIKL